MYFTCPLTGAILRKDQRDTRIKEAILSVSRRSVPPSLTLRFQVGAAFSEPQESQLVQILRSVFTCVYCVCCHLFKEVVLTCDKNSGYKKGRQTKTTSPPPPSYPSRMQPLWVVQVPFQRHFKYEQTTDILVSPLHLFCFP